MIGFEFEERDYWEIERGDKEYLEIENFKDYELTECLAFEMFRRNSTAKQQREDINQVLDIHQKAVFEFIANEEAELNKDGYDSYIKSHYKAVEFRDKFFYSHFDCIKVNNNFLNFDDYVSSSKEHQMRKSYELTSYKNGLIGIRKKEKESIKVGLLDEIDHNIQPIFRVKSDLFPVFSRPLPYIPNSKTKEALIPLNLALPKDELVAYVKAIKDNYDKDHTTISFDREVKPSSAINELKPRGFGKKLEVPNMKKRLYADMFFVYDCLNTKDGKEHRNEAIKYVMSELENYYSEILADDTINKKHKERIGDKKFKERLKEKLKADYTLGRTPKTIKKYFKLMHDFIDNERYKELLTGEKVK